jgi:hypothetical protein
MDLVGCVMISCVWSWWLIDGGYVVYGVYGGYVSVVLGWMICVWMDVMWEIERVSFFFLYGRWRVPCVGGMGLLWDIVELRSMSCVRFLMMYMWEG